MEGGGQGRGSAAGGRQAGAPRCGRSGARPRRRGPGPRLQLRPGLLVAREGRGGLGRAAVPPLCRGRAQATTGTRRALPRLRERRLVPAASLDLAASSESRLVSVMGLGGEPRVAFSLADSRSPHSAQGS